MKKIFLGIFLTVIFFVSPAISQQTLNKKQENKKASSLLWKIEGNNLKVASYLFGTIHLISADKYFFNSEMENAFKSAEEVVFEIDMNAISDMGTMMELFSMARMPDGKSLSDLLTPEEYELVKTKIEASGLPMMFFDNIKPLFLSALGMDATGSETSGMVSYEIKLTEKANAQNKIISGMESIQEQMSAVDSIPLEVQAKMLVESFKTTETTSFVQLEDVYLTQDIEKLHAETSNEQNGLEAKYMDFLLRDRNHKWIPRMEEKMKEKVIFFAVGAGHLGGDNGVILLLKNAGYKVTPVLSK